MIRATLILDVGASGGVWSGTCSMIFPEAEYFLIEPLIYPEEYWPVPGVNHHWIRKTVGSRNDNVEMIVRKWESDHVTMPMCFRLPRGVFAPAPLSRKSWSHRQQ